MRMLGQRHLEHFIGGGWVSSRGGQRLPVINPATEQSIATVPVVVDFLEEAREILATQRAWIRREPRG